VRPGGPLEESPIPPECRHLNYLLSAPFRYFPYPHASRFRRSGLTLGVFYGAEEPETAVAEMDYAQCQAFADSARAALVEIIRYASVRDPQMRANLAVLTCSAFKQSDPIYRQTWRIHLSETGARALCEFPRKTIAFDQAAFATDPRLAKMVWAR
jgi:RES domain